MFRWLKEYKWEISVLELTGFFSALYIYYNRALDIAALGQMVILGVTAAAVFRYAKVMHEDFVERQTPGARIRIPRIPMTDDSLLTQVLIENLKGIPFRARVNLRMQIGDKKVKVGSPLYDGEEEWEIFTGSFEGVFSAIGGLREAQQKDSTYNLDQLFPQNVDSLPQNLRDIVNRVSLSPIMLYGNERRQKIAAGGRYYLAPLKQRELKELGLIATNDRRWYWWLPDPQKSHHLPKKWEGQPLTEEEIER